MSIETRTALTVEEILAYLRSERDAWSAEVSRHSHGRGSRDALGRAISWITERYPEKAKP